MTIFTRKNHYYFRAKMRTKLLSLFITILTTLVSQADSLCEMGDLWLIRQFEPTNSQYWANWLNVCPTQKINCNGEIMEWNFYSTSDDGSPIYLSVWRQIEPTGFQLIGYNEVNATRVGVVRFPIDKPDRIRAKAGDVFGIYYEHRESTGSVAFIAGVGSSSHTRSNHVLHSCLSQQLTKDEVEQYMDANGRIVFKGRPTQKLFMVQAVVHDENEIMKKPTAEPIPSCGPIPQIANAIIVNYQPSGARVTGLLGDTIEFECRDTYKLVGPRLVRCNANERWSEVPHCEATVFCGTPPVVENGFFTPEIGQADTGTVIKYECEHGHSFAESSPGTNNSLVVCQMDGTWSKAPSCNRVESNCGLPPSISFATAIPLYDTNRKVALFGDSVRYKCEVGYFLMGNDTITCGLNGHWSSELPRCGGLYRLCDNKLPEVDNAQVVYSSTEPFSVAFYICRQGFFGEGNRAHIRCLPDGTWEKPDYLCNRKLQHTRGAHAASAQQVVGAVQCKNPPPQVENAIVIVRSTEPGAPATYLCLEDHRPFGNATIICNDDGVWRGDPDFACVRTATSPPVQTTTPLAPPPVLNTCGDPPQIPHATGWQLYRGRPSQPGDVVKFLCADRYTLVGNLTVECLGDGQWSVLPVCELTEPDCDWPPDIPHAVLVSNVDGLEAAYECQEGYVKSGGTMTIICYENQWSQPLFTCDPVKCGEPPVVQNADWVPKGIGSPGTVVIYECFSKFKMVGSDSIVCQSSGVWTNEPECIEIVSCGPPPTIPNANIVSSTGFTPEGSNGTCTSCPSGSGNRTNTSLSTPGSTVTYGCINGYRPSQNRTTTYCQNDRTWSTPLPSCEPALYKQQFLAAFWPLSRCYGVRDISGHSFHGTAPILFGFHPAMGPQAPAASIAQFGPNRYVEIRHYRDQFNFAGRSYSFVMYVGPSTVDGPLIEYDTVSGRLGFHVWVQGSQLYVYYEPKHFIYSGYTGGEIKTPVIDFKQWNFVGSVYDFSTGMASLWLEGQKVAEKYVGQIYPEMSQGFYIGQHKRYAGDPRQFQGQQISCVGAYTIALNSVDMVELKRLCLRLLACNSATSGVKGNWPMSTNMIMSKKVTQEGLEKPPLMSRDLEALERKRQSVTSERVVKANNKSNKVIRPKPVRPLPSRDMGRAVYTTPRKMPEFPFANAKLVVHASPTGTTASTMTTAESPLGASCGRVPYVSNAMVSDGFANGSSHTGDTATYRCFTGYDLIGTAIVHCHSNGEWTLPPKCVDRLSGTEPETPNQCSEPDAVDNADILFTNRTIGGVTLYRCKHGFALSGSAIVFCQRDGTWSDLPACSMVDCGKPPNVKNGDVRYDQTSFGNQAFYTCNAGYQLQGFQIATCTETGVWFQIPTCHGSSCLPPKNISNGKMIPLRGDGRQPGSAFKVSCNSNYKLSEDENDTMICQPDGQWSKPPVCNEIECGGLPVIPNGIIRPPPPNKTEVNRVYIRTVTVTCQNGYRLKGPSTLVCHGDGTWSEPPTCEQFSCETPPVVNNAIQSYSSLLPGSVVSYECREGFKLSGNVEIRCSADGRWIGAPPTCREMLCHPPVLHPGTSYKYSNERLIVGTSVTFTCYNGSYLEGNNTAICLSNGQWSKMGRCLPVTCGLPPTVSNSFIVRLDGYNFSNSISYSCKEGYTMTGPSTITCSAKGRWSKPPRCDPPPCPAPQLIDHGSVNFRTPITSGTKATYACSPGYELIGLANLTCLINGEWNDIPPSCQPLSCGNPPEIPNSMVTIFCNTEVCTVGEKVIYECPPQWHLVGSPVVTCLPDRQWSHIPSCVAKNVARASETRSFLPYSAAGELRKSRFYRTFVNEANSIEIDHLPQHHKEPSYTNHETLNPHPFYPHPPYSSRPQSMPQFLTSNPPQEKKRASLFPLPNFFSGGSEHLESENANTAPASVSPLIDPFHSMRHPFTEEAMPWMEVSTMSIDLLTCGQAPFVPNSLVSFSFVGDGSRPGDTARYACSGDFQMRGPDVVVCLDSGHWSVVPACESPCPMLSLRNGFVTYYNHSVQTVVEEILDTDDMQVMPTYRNLNHLYRDELKLDASLSDFDDDHRSPSLLLADEPSPSPSTDTKPPTLPDLPQSKLPPTQPSMPASSNGPGLIQFEFRYTSSVHEGTVARFGCESSFDIVGPREAICQKDGTWSAPIPKCTACHQMSVGDVPPAMVLNEVAYLMSPNLTLFIDMRFNCSGRLTSWVYYCRSREAEQAAGAYLSVWRPSVPNRIPAPSRHHQRAVEYRLVGKTFVKPRQYGFNVHNLTDQEAIAVKYGDIVGFHYAVPSIPARYLTIPIATQRDPWPFDAGTLSRTYSIGFTDRDIVRDENVVRLRHDYLQGGRQIPAIKAVLSPSFLKKR